MTVGEHLKILSHSDFIDYKKHLSECSVDFDFNIFNKPMDDRGCTTWGMWTKIPGGSPISLGPKWIPIHASRMSRLNYMLLVS